MEDLNFKKILDCTIIFILKKKRIVISYYLILRYCTMTTNAINNLKIIFSTIFKFLHRFRIKKYAKKLFCSFDKKKFNLERVKMQDERV